MKAFQEAFTSSVSLMLSYGVSINLINLGKEVICCWKDGWCRTANARKEKEEREGSG